MGDGMRPFSERGEVPTGVQRAPGSDARPYEYPSTRTLFFGGCPEEEVHDEACGGRSYCANGSSVASFERVMDRCWIGRHLSGNESKISNPRAKCI